MKKLKLAIVTPYPPSAGTLNEYAFHLVKQFKIKEEVEEIIIFSDKLPEGQSYEEVTGGCKVSIRESWSFNDLFTFIKLNKEIKKSGADVVLYNIQFLSFGDKKIPATLGLLSPLVSRIIGVPSMVLLHNIIETVDYTSAGITDNKIMAAIYNIFGTILTRIILMANLVGLTMPKYVDIVEKKYNVKNVVYMPHGSFELPALPNFNIPAGPKKVMTFGKFGTYKKVEKLIEATEIVRQRTGEEIELVIAGSDNPNVKGYLKSVKEQYAHVPNITFTGYVAEEEVPVIFGEATAVVFPYTSTTGSSGVLHQAGSYGKAVVLPNIGDLKELIEEEGYRGAYFQPENAEDMADAIEKLIIDEDYRTMLAQKNYAAAASLPMSDIAEWYLMHFNSIRKKLPQAATNKNDMPRLQLS